MKNSGECKQTCYVKNSAGLLILLITDSFIGGSHWFRKSRKRFQKGLFSMRSKSDEKAFHIMLIPAMVFLFVFSVIPMFGVIMAFQRYVPAKGIFGSDFVGWDNFARVFLYKDVRLVIGNTVIIAVGKIVLGLLASVIFALMLNEVKFTPYKRFVQTVAYLPNFLSWVILGIMISNMFSYTGVVNTVLGAFGIEPRIFLIDNNWFRPIVVGSDVWKTFGYGAIVYIAAITAIDSNIYEAAEIDGANRWHKIIYITLPSIRPTIVLLATLSLGSVLNAGFEQILVMYNPLVYSTADIIDTYVYRMGLVQLQFSFGTAVGLFKSVVSFVLIIISYVLADKFAGYSIF